MRKHTSSAASPSAAWVRCSSLSPTAISFAWRAAMFLACSLIVLSTRERMESCDEGQLAPCSLRRLGTVNVSECKKKKIEPVTRRNVCPPVLAHACPEFLHSTMLGSGKCFEHIYPFLLSNHSQKITKRSLRSHAFNRRIWSERKNSKRPFSEFVRGENQQDRVYNYFLGYFLAFSGAQRQAAERKSTRRHPRYDRQS